MLIEATLLLGLLKAEACPTAFNQTVTTVSGISNSRELILCASKSYLVRGRNGSLTLVLNSNQQSPQCLVYPNGLPSDLAFDLLTSGHTGCWSLYPPGEPITIVNVGKPAQAKLAQALNSFRPLQPRILVSPSRTTSVGTLLVFSNTAKPELQKGTMLNLPCEVRFRPVAFKWNYSGQIFTGSSFSSLPSNEGNFPLTLVVSFSVEYRFPGLIAWRTVKPNIQSNATPITISISKSKVLRHRPKLVDQPCFSPIRWGC